MTSILLVETASPKRVRNKAESILAGKTYPSPQLTLLCSDDPGAIRYFGEIKGAEVVPLLKHQTSKILRNMSSRHFDVLLAFWTGEEKYRRMKLSALRIRAKSSFVEAGDGNVFRPTWKAFIRHGLFRLRHRLPSDHWKFVSQAGSGVPHCGGEKILVIQSAAPPYVLQALQNMRDRPLFQEPRYTLFCRNSPEILRCFEAHPMLYEVRTHSETRQAWKHLLALRRERFDAVVVFFTGDPSYWKIKYFAFLAGARRKVVYNENGDCFYLTLGRWINLISHRLSEWANLGIQPRWAWKMRLVLLLLIKFLVLPFRFCWLLLIWLKLRIAGHISRSAGISSHSS